MRYSTIVPAVLACAQLVSTSGTKCTANSNGCTLNHASAKCGCVSNYSPGDTVYPMCYCITNGIKFYADESNTWVEAQHFTCAATIQLQCQSCMETC